VPKRLAAQHLDTADAVLKPLRVKFLGDILTLGHQLTRQSRR
jgi:hypothetical protein